MLLLELFQHKIEVDQIDDFYNECAEDCLHDVKIRHFVEVFDVVDVPPTHRVPLHHMVCYRSVRICASYQRNRYEARDKDLEVRHARWEAKADLYKPG